LWRWARQLAHELDEVLQPLLTNLAVGLHPSTNCSAHIPFDQLPSAVA
jgi:hypothetical protein